MTSLVLAALAAALVGHFRSFPLATAAGLGSISRIRNDSRAASSVFRPSPVM